MAAPLRFEVLARSAQCGARLGRVHTPHGSFDTPAFMPVGTRGSVKGVLPRDLAGTGAQICLNNTYHLLLRPGPELVARMSGVHRFMNWAGPILTDSGGYQAYSLSATNRVDDDAVTFKSIVDGRMIELTPQRAIEVQNQLGADIIMALDDCPPPIAGGTEEHADPAQAARLRSAAQRDKLGGAAAWHQRLRVANERTVRWLERCKAAHGRPHDQALFGIVQGGTDLDQRTWCAQHVCAIDLPGYAIGGVAVGESPEQIARVVRHTAPLLPADKPRYLMGVGYERDLLAAVLAGVDMFDCVLPTRNGRNANAFTPTGQLRLRNAQYQEDPRPLQEGCDCLACQADPKTGLPFSRSYIRHLFMAGEMLGPMLVSLHNLRHFQRFMLEVRAAIASDGWRQVVDRYPVVGHVAGLAAGANTGEAGPPPLAGA